MNFLRIFYNYIKNKRGRLFNFSNKQTKMTLYSNMLKMIILSILLFDPINGSLRPTPIRPSTVPAPPPPPAMPSPSTTCNVFP